MRWLDELPAKVANRLVRQLSPETQASVAIMLGYEQGSVGRILSAALVSVRQSATVAEALAKVPESVLRAEHLGTVFVLDADRRYEGLVRLANLVRARPETPVNELVESTEVLAHATEDAAEAARRLQRRDLDALPVVDGEGRLIGALTVDDAMDALDVDTTATMMGKAGIADPGHAMEVLRSEKLTPGLILYPVRVRLSFLIVTLIGGLAVGGLIERFEDTLASVVALAIFIRWSWTWAATWAPSRPRSSPGASRWDRLTRSGCAPTSGGKCGWAS